MVGGRYRLNRLLGEGGMARVFDAFDERLERPVAVKVLRPEIGTLPGMRKRFQQEARISARLVHPHIVAVLDYGEDGSASYLVMERLPGHTLRDEIAGGPVSAQRVVTLTGETLTALAAAHKCGVLHRDIKPSNILLDENGHAVITDFGIAKSFDARAGSDPTMDLTMTGVVLGTPGYLAPERRAGHSATVQSDLYSVGAVMVEALCGRRPTPGAAVDPDLPPALGSVALRALVTDPRQRFGSADEMLHALRSTGRGPAPAAAGTGTTQQLVGETAAFPPTSVFRAPPAPPPQARQRHWSRFALPGLAAAIVAVLLLLFVVEGGHPTAPGTPSTSRTDAVVHPSPSVAESNAIKRVATSLAGAGLPGDAALASALEATAAAKPGARRESAAQQSLNLAGVLLAGGGITQAQFQDVAGVLQSTGATVPTTTTTTTTTTVPATVPTPPGPGGHKDHGGIGVGPAGGPAANSGDSGNSGFGLGFGG
jgi:eukaryotic-like serine/threonine-protein kinase